MVPHVQRSHKSSVTESDVERIFHPKTVPKKTCHKHGERGPNLRLAAIEIGSATAMGFVHLI
jgi:hypothetical protein